jgi:hypothetical protein
MKRAGSGPLVVNGSRFVVPPDRQAAVLQLVSRPDDSATLRSLLAQPFTSGSPLKHLLDRRIELAVTPADLIQTVLAQADPARALAAKADWLYGHIRVQEWVTSRAGYGWLNGCCDNGRRRVEGDHTNGVRMMLIGQVFTLMGGSPTGAQAAEIVRAADRYLLIRGLLPPKTSMTPIRKPRS